MHLTASLRRPGALLGALTALLAPAPALAGPGDVSLFAGGAGSGTDATRLVLGPNDVTLSRGQVVASDATHSTVRAVAADGTARTLAGIGAALGGYPGALIGGDPQVPLGIPGAVATLPDGDVLVFDRGRNVVHRIDADTGAVTRFAGRGVPSATADDRDSGQPAVAIRLLEVGGIAVDRAGGVLLAESATSALSGAPTLWRVDPAGIARAVAGGGDTTNTLAGANQPAVGARIVKGGRIAVLPGGDVLWAETGSSASNGNRIRIVRANPDTGLLDGSGPIETLLGSVQDGVAGQRANSPDGRYDTPTDIRVDQPDALAVLADGRVVFHARSSGLRTLDLSTGELATLIPFGTRALPADEPTLAQATIWRPTGLYVDGTRLLIADSLRGFVQEVDLGAAEPVLRRVLGTPNVAVVEDGPATALQLDQPRAAVAAPDGSVFIADGNHRRVLRVHPDGRVERVLGVPGVTAVTTQDGVPGRETVIANPAGLALGPDGTLYVLEGTASGQGRRVRALDPVTQTTRTILGDGTNGSLGDGGPGTAARINNARRIAASPDGRRLYVADTGNFTVRAVDLADGVVTTVAGTRGSAGDDGDGGLATDATLGELVGLAVFSDGDLLLADKQAGRLRRVDAATGTIHAFLGGSDTPEYTPPDDPAKVALAGGVRFADRSDPFSESRRLADVAVRRDGLVAISAAGSVLLVEPGGPLVRRVVGVVSAGEPVFGFNGDTTVPGTARSISDVPGPALAFGGADLFLVEVGTNRVLRLEPPTPELRIDTVDAPALDAGGAPGTLTLTTGRTLGPVALDAGPGIVVEAVRRAGPTTIVAKVRASDGAAPGPRAVTLIAGEDRARVTAERALTVRAPAPAPTPTPIPQPVPPPVPPAAPPTVLDTPPAPLAIDGLRLARAATLRTLTARGVALTVRPPAGTRVQIELSVSATGARRLGLRSRGRTALVARTVAARGGRSVSVRLRPTARVRRQLARARPSARTVTARVRVVLLHPDGRRAERTANLRLRTR